MFVFRLIQRCVLFILIAALCLSCAASLAEETGISETDGEIEVETADASGSLVSAANAAAGAAGSLKNFAHLNGLPIILYTTTGWLGIYSGDGARSNPCTIQAGITGYLYGLSRIDSSSGHYHYACVRVVATYSGVTQERYLWVNSLGGSTPALIPAYTARSAVEHGDLVSIETGIPNARVELTDLDGNFIIAAQSDENGYVIFDAAHTENGDNRYYTYTYSFGNYDYHAATAYASNPANLLPSVGGTDHEWVANQSCATFQSRILCAAGFPVYTPYTEGANNPGQGLWMTLKGLIGDEFCKKEFTIDDLHEGDIIWIRKMGHAMYCSEVNREEQTVHAYAHSTSVTSAYTDDCWVSLSDICAVAMMVTDQECVYSYRIDGVTEPRMLTITDDDGAVIDTAIVTAGAQYQLPTLEDEALRSFQGWVCGGEAYNAGDVVTIDTHMTFAASWAYPITEGQADFILPDGLLRIEADAFQGIAACTVYIQDGCQSIGDGAFAGCENLRQVRIPEGCAVSSSAFEGCSSLTIFGKAGSGAEQFCQQHEGFTFREE